MRPPSDRARSPVAGESGCCHWSGSLSRACGFGTPRCSRSAALVGIADSFPLSRVPPAWSGGRATCSPPRAGDAATSRYAGARCRSLFRPAFVAARGVCFKRRARRPVDRPRLGAARPRRCWPVELLPELREHQRDRPRGTRRVFCEYAYGGFLIYFTPGYRVFIDDRCELFGDEFLTRFVGDAGGARPRASTIPGRAVRRMAGLNTAPLTWPWWRPVAAFDEALAELPQAWEVVRRTETATLYRKRAAP